MWTVGTLYAGSVYLYHSRILCNREVTDGKSIFPDPARTVSCGIPVYLGTEDDIHRSLEFPEGNFARYTLVYGNNSIVCLSSFQAPFEREKCDIKLGDCDHAFQRRNDSQLSSD